MYPLKIKEVYEQENLANLGHRFTVPYLGNYISGNTQELAGSHPGVDIIPVSKNQEVHSILDAVVFKSGEDGAYGKYVFLEHKDAPNPEDLSKTTTLFSCYQHLSNVKVDTGDILKEGDIIGNTGNTGNSFGEHLHFQIDKKEAPFHAYWPFTGAEAKEAGVSFSGGVNIGLGLDKAKMYTINPLVYLNNIEKFRKNGNNNIPLQEKIVEEKIVEEKIVEEKNPVIIEEKVKIEKVIKEEIPIIVEEKLEEKKSVLSSSEEKNIITPIISFEKTADLEKKQIKEEKIQMIKSDDDIIVTNSSIEFLKNMELEESKKKNLKI